MLYAAIERQKPERMNVVRLQIIYNPPYNRGKNDFRYDDIYISEEDTFRNSKWLSFMSERLLQPKN